MLLRSCLECEVYGKKPSWQFEQVKSCQSRAAQGTNQLDKTFAWTLIQGFKQIKKNAYVQIWELEMEHEVISLLFKTSKSFKADFVAFKVILYSLEAFSYFGTMWLSSGFLD